MKVTNGKNSISDKRILYSERKRFFSELKKDILHPVVDIDNSYGKMEAFLVRIPRTDKMKTVALPGMKPVLLIEPVADALIDLVYYYNDLVVQGKIPSGSRMGTLSVFQGYSDLEFEYNAYQDKIYTSFLAFMDSNLPKKKKILDFDSFIDQFSDFLINFVARQGQSITRTSFYKYGDRFFTSLYVKFRELDFSRDSVKANNIVNSSDFYAFQDSLKRFGFLLEKESLGIGRFDRSVQLLEKRGEVQRYDDSFYFPHLIEKDSIKFWFINCYLSFVGDNPVLSDYCFSSSKLKKISRERELPDFEVLGAARAGEDWQMLVWRMRAAEERVAERDIRKLNQLARKYVGGSERLRAQLVNQHEIMVNKLSETK